MSSITKSVGAGVFGISTFGFEFDMPARYSRILKDSQ
jgi:hypothetical protein